MLILTRSPGESFFIDKQTKVIFLGLNSRGQGKFGIEAPPSVSINREEIQTQINSGTDISFIRKQPRC